MNDEKGLVTQIMGSSFVDGPGIRTTIFLKGCPLRCLWCCNPENQELYPEKNLLFPEKGNIDTFGEWLTVNEVMEIIKKDIVFYRASGGGVTIAGGEPTYQPTFTLELIRQCKELGIHTALDTCGYTASKQGIKVLEEGDLLLFDLKNMDSDEHERNTGLRNDVILENLRRMAQLKKPIIVRMPLIPDYTDTPENIRAIADFLVSLGNGSIRQIDILPYHEGGITKYEMLGKSYPLSTDLNPQSDEYLEQVKETLTSTLYESCTVNIGGG